MKSIAALILTVLLGMAMQAENLIQTENALTGTREWQLTNPATAGWPTVSNSVVPEIEGYASATSVNVNETITFFIDVRDGSPMYELEIYRLGWYGGRGGRKMTWSDAGIQTSIVTLPSQKQPIPYSVAGYIDCSSFWSPSYLLTIPGTWRSGVYLAKLTTTQLAKQSYIIFVVREDSRPSDMLFQSSVTTFQAYNPWGGMSAYPYPKTPTYPATVSFNRPYAANAFPWPIPAKASATATFVGADSTRQGDWIEAHGARRYGKDGYNVIRNNQNLPGFCTITTDGSQYEWANPDSLDDTRALRQVDSSGNVLNSRIGATWFGNPSFTVDINLTDGYQHRIAFYCLDWDCLGTPRTQKIEVYDASSDSLLDTCILPISPSTNFCNGVYLTWRVGGHVKFKFTTLTPYGNAVASGLFFDPTAVGYPNLAYGTGAGEFFTQINSAPGPGWEYNALRWLERQGYDVTYCTSIDTFTGTPLQKGIKTFLSVGHDEYWSPEMRANVEFARDHGVNLAFLSANACYWRIHFDSLSRLFSVDKNPNSQTYDLWRGPVINNPEISMIGVQFVMSPPFSSDIQLHDPLSIAPFDWAYGYTGLQQGSILPGLLGYEVDGEYNTYPAPNGEQFAPAPPPGRVTLTSSPVYDPYLHAPARAHSTIYTAASGASVFATGSMQWNWGLDDYGWQHQLAPDGPPRSHVNTAAQQMTHNILSLFTGSSTTKPVIFSNSDGATQGSWRGAYGAEGCMLASGTGSDFLSLPSAGWAKISIQSQTPLLWAGTSSDVRALQKPTPSTDRIAAAWSSPDTFTIDVTLLDGNSHPVGLYCIDWLGIGITQKIEVINADTGLIEDTRDFTVPANGAYLLWNLSGHHQLRITRTDNIPGSTAVVSGVFFGGAGTAQFAGADLLTQGNWISGTGVKVYGHQGYNIILDRESYPAYARVSTDADPYLWAYPDALADTGALRYVDPNSGSVLSNRIVADGTPDHISPWIST